MIEIASALILVKFDHDQWWPNHACAASRRPSCHVSLPGRSNGPHFDGRRDDDPGSGPRAQCRLCDQSWPGRPSSELAISDESIAAGCPHQLKTSYAAIGRLKPFKFKSPMCETFTDCSIVPSAR